MFAWPIDSNSANVFIQNPIFTNTKYTKLHLTHESHTTPNYLKNTPPPRVIGRSFQQLGAIASFPATSLKFAIIILASLWGRSLTGANEQFEDTYCRLARSTSFIRVGVIWRTWLWRWVYFAPRCLWLRKSESIKFLIKLVFWCLLYVFLWRIINKTDFGISVLMLIGNWLISIVK